MKAELFECEILSFNQIGSLIQSALGRNQPVSEKQAYQNLRSLTPCSFERFANTVVLLGEIGIVRTDQEGFVSREERLRDLRDADFREVLGRAILQGLEVSGALNEICIAAQFSEHSARVIVDSKIIPWRYRHIRPLLTEIGFFIRGSIYERHWQIAPYAEAGFLRAVRSQNSEMAHSRGLSAVNLRSILETQSALGAAAERWVFERERRRLSAHPLHDQIALISQANVGAGYDIASFSSARSLLHDRFIEVKSFSGHPSFYWSAVEADAAMELGQDYALCLVDRDRMSEEGYEPMFIFEPYRRLLVETPDGWQITTDSYLISYNGRG